MISAIISNKNGGTLATEFPCDIYNLYSELHSVGIMNPPGDMKLTDNEDDPISVKLYSGSDFGNHFIQILNERNSLSGANTAAYVVSNANELIRENLEQQIIYDQYRTLDKLYADIRQMIYDAGWISETFYFSLVGTIYERECSDIYTVGISVLVRCETKSVKYLKSIWSEIHRIWLSITTKPEARSCYPPIGIWSISIMSCSGK